MLFAACMSGCERLHTQGATDRQPPNMARLSKAFVRVDQQALAIDGSIEASTPDEFRRLLDRNPDTKRIHLRSGGGEVTAAMEIGREIRKRGLNVVVDGQCSSSCANYLFIAGIHKSVVKGGMLLMHGGATFNAKRVFAQFPKTTSRSVAIRAIR